MIKAIIFDLDGVLVETKELHFETLNKALAEVDPKFVISKEEHFAHFDAKTTRQKLNLLTVRKGLNETEHDDIWKAKQRYTHDALDSLPKNYTAQFMISKFKDKGYKVFVGSNSIRISVEKILEQAGLLNMLDGFLSNEDVAKPKPHSLMYNKIIVDACLDPQECLIVEDSPVGREAALKTGAHVYPVNTIEDVSYTNIKQFIEECERKKFRMKWKDRKLNVLIPLAGEGTRFKEVGHKLPKPLLSVRGKPMIQVVVENLNIDAKFIFIVRMSHQRDYNLNYLLELIAPNCEIIGLDKTTEGAACTTLLAKEFINSDDSLLIANSDQFVEWNSNDFMYHMRNSGVDGGILTFPATNPRWSFAKIDENGYVSEVAEKNPISNIATVGIYYWKKGRDYVNCAEKMIEKDIRTNNEFYVCPVYNEAIKRGMKIKTYDVDRMWGLGTPEDYDNFLENYEP